MAGLIKKSDISTFELPDNGIFACKCGGKVSFSLYCYKENDVHIVTLICRCGYKYILGTAN